MLMLTRPDFPADRLEEARRRDIARITAAPRARALLDITVARTLAPAR